MNILRDISIRKMVIIILALFSVIWGSATFLTFDNFGKIDNLLIDNTLQKKSYSLLVKGNDQYFRTMTRMLRAIDYRQSGDESNAIKTFDSAASALKISQSMLEQFRIAQHPGVSDDLVQSMFNDWDTLLATAIAPMLDMARNNQSDKFRELFRNVYPALSVQFGAIAEKYTQAIQSDETINQTQTRVIYNKYILISALIAGIITLLLTDRYIVNYLNKPLNIIKQHLELLKAGKLHYTLNHFGNNCIGQLVPYICNMQESLFTTVKAIQESSENIYSSTNHIRRGNEELSARTDQQAAALQQTAASMEELTSTVRNNAENVRMARKLTEDAQGTAKTGGNITTTVVATMDGISESSKKIADITSVINSISFQTNILALNAAVEAARAGEQGRGFAVVASEVRALAQRSAVAAKEIEGLINDSVIRVKSGADQVKEAGNAMSLIINSVAQVNTLMGEISIASDEQSRGIEQIGQAMAEMDRATQKNAVLVQESASSAVMLESEAEQLTNTIALFELGENNKKMATPTTRQSISKPQLPMLEHTQTKNTKDNWQAF